MVQIYLKDQEGNIWSIIHQNSGPDPRFTSLLHHWLLRRNSRYSAIQGRMNLAHKSQLSAVNVPVTVPEVWAHIDNYTRIFQEVQKWYLHIVPSGVKLWQRSVCARQFTTHFHKAPGVPGEELSRGSHPGQKRGVLTSMMANTDRARWKLQSKRCKLKS